MDRPALRALRASLLAAVDALDAALNAPWTVEEQAEMVRRQISEADDMPALDRLLALTREQVAAIPQAERHAILQAAIDETHALRKAELEAPRPLGSPATVAYLRQFPGFQRWEEQQSRAEAVHLQAVEAPDA